MSLPDFWEVNSERDEENPKISFEQMKKTITTKRNSSSLDILASFI